jgi:hypothetical protein
MEATIPETRPPPKQRDREGRNRVPGYDVLSYATGILPRQTPRGEMHTRPGRRI